ncbi:MAG: hypothetical protein ACXVIH_05695 [Ilumatobacteraceae bacterium]
MGIQRKIPEPVSITNTSGQPEIVLEIDGLVISMTPPGSTPPPIHPDADPAEGAP